MVDLCNRSPTSGAALSKTVSYLTAHGLGALKDLDLLYLYHLVVLVKKKQTKNFSTFDAGVDIRNIFERKSSLRWQSKNYACNGRK